MSGIHRLLLVAAILVVLGGCYADLDWREIRAPSVGYGVLMPARTQEQSRPLVGLTGEPVMHMWSATALDTLFGFGYLERPAKHAIRLTDLGDALVRNIAGKIVSTRQMKSGDLTGLELVAVGEVGGRPAQLHARLIEDGSRIIQLAVLGPPGKIGQADLEMFLDSLRIGRF